MTPYDRIKTRRTAGLLTASLTMTGAVWAWWFIDPSAPQGPALPAALSTALAANVALSLTSMRLKRAVVAPVQQYLINPPVRALLRLGLMPLGYALLETRGRATGLPRTTPVGNGLQGGAFWVIAEHGLQASYVRNIRRCPDVRLKLRQGWHFVWINGTAHILPDDNPYARQRRLSRWHPLRALNLAIVRIMGTNLLTIRIDLHTSQPPDTLPETRRTAHTPTFGAATHSRRRPVDPVPLKHPASDPDGPRLAKPTPGQHEGP